MYRGGFVQLVHDGDFHWSPSLQYQERPGSCNRCGGKPVSLLNLVAESRRKPFAGGALAHPQSDFASSAVSGDCWTVSRYSNPQHHSRHMIAVVFHDELIRQGIRNRRLGRYMRNEVTVEKPVTWRRSPIHSHGSAS